MQYQITHNYPGCETQCINADSWEDAYKVAVDLMTELELTPSDILEIEDEDGETRQPADIVPPVTQFEHTVFDDDGSMFHRFLWTWTSGAHGYPGGSFAESLFKAFINADGDNLARLSLVYPAVASAYAAVKKGFISYPTQQEWESINATKTS
jgi:hypothetical protein